MRTSRVLAAAVAALVPLGAHAQTPAQPPAQPSATAAPPGVVDVGVRGTSADGDAARFERYRDLADGLFLQRFRFDTERSGWFITLAADQAARRDQRFTGLFVQPGTLKVWGQWDQIPMLMSDSTRTLFTGDLDEPLGSLTIPQSVRTEIQPSAGASPNVSLLPGVFARNNREFVTRSRRDILQTGLEYIVTPELTVRSQFTSTKREGTLPYGASFGHGALVEFPAPIQHRLNDFESSGEFVRDPVLLRAGFSGSWFHNEFTRVVVDSPFRAFDAANASAAAGLSLPPSNSLLSVNGLASVKLPARSRLTAYLSVGSLKDAGDALMAQTVNTQLSPAPLPRSVVNGEARTLATNLSLTSRPGRYLDMSVRYRAYDYDNQTPIFVMPQRVAYDNSTSPARMSTLGGVSHVPEHGDITGVITEPFGVLRHTFDADLRVLPRVGSAGLGYSRIQEERSHRFFETTTENVVRLTYDAIGNQMFSVRTKYEHARRRGEVTDEAREELFDIGEQPGMRHFDLASRNRNRVTLLGSVTPTATLALNGSVAAGKDDYIESLFGLRDNTHRVYSAGADVVPSDRVNLGGSYSYERYEALSRSRQASPPNAAQGGPLTFERFLEESRQPGSPWEVADARRNWATDATDRVHSVILYAGIQRIGDKVDLDLSYDYSRARAHYEYMTGPVADRTLPEEVVIPTTLPLPDQLPPVRSEIQRGTADLVYALTDRLGVGLTFWHERYRVRDFTLDTESTPNLARTNAVLLGYLYRPYTANTVWGRLIYRW